MAEVLSTVFLDGQFLARDEARISPLDRGFLFGDAVYEVIPVFAGKPLLMRAHLTRLANSLADLEIPNPHSDDEWRDIVAGLVERNGGGDLGIYLQVSRGADSGRDHLTPDNITPTVFGMVSPIADDGPLRRGISVITHPENRWARRDIKSTSLVANVLLRNTAHAAGATEAILHEDGKVTEASTSSVFIVANGILITRPNSTALLPGTTRQLVMDLARKAEIPCEEAEFSVADLKSADEVWLMSATRGVVPVTTVDGESIGNGEPGPVWAAMDRLFAELKANPEGT